MHFPLKFEFARDKRCPWPPYAKHLVRDKISSMITRRIKNCFYALRKTLPSSFVFFSNERDSLRKAREAHIIYKAKTLEPLSINKRDQL